MGVTAENFTKICRLCLSEKSDLIKFYHQTDVIKRLSECTTVKVHRNDDLPKLICTLCLCQLNTSYAFKNLCESSDTELRNFLYERQERLLTENDVSSHENLSDASHSETNSEAGGESIHEDETSTFQNAAHEEISHEPKRRRMCCLFCKKYVDSLPTHLMTYHQDEDDVIEFQKYPSRSRKRLSIIGHIRRQGNYNAHIAEKKALSAQKGEQKHTNSIDYVPCTNCLGYFSKASLLYHIRNCRKKNTSNRRTISVTKSTTLTTKLSASKILATSILPLVRPDSVLKEIKSDPLILMYGSELCIRNDIKLTSVKIRIRKLIRQIARLLLAMKKVNHGITQLIDIFDDKYVDAVMTAIDDIAEFNSETNSYTKYNLAAGLAAGIRKCGNIIIANAVIRGNDTLKITVMNYLKSFDDRFGKQFKNYSKKRVKPKSTSGEVDSVDVNEDMSTSEGQSTEIENPIGIVSDEQDLLLDSVSEQHINTDIEKKENEKKRKNPEDSDAESMSSIPTTVSENDGEEGIESDRDKVVKRVRKKDDDDESSSKKRYIRRSWSTPEQDAVRKHFCSMMELGTLPTKQQVVDCLSEEACLKGRTWQQVKAWISNQFRIMRKDLNKSYLDME